MRNTYKLLLSNYDNSGYVMAGVEIIKCSIIKYGGETTSHILMERDKGVKLLYGEGYVR